MDCRVRYKQLGYLALNVSDLERSRKFYCTVLGMQEVEGNDPSVCYLRCSDKHHDIALYRGTPGLKRVAFELESEAQIEPLKAVLSSHQRPFTDIPHTDRKAMHVGPGIRTTEPATGTVLDFYVGMDTSAAPPYQHSVAKILRLGHLVVKSTKFDESVSFFTKVLNFDVSDSIDQRVTFLRCFPNPYHHSIGIGNAKSNGLHHVAFMVTDVDDIGTSYWRLQKEGVTIVNGPGRHLPSGSMFLYYLDPDGLTLEYTLGMEEFPEHEPRPARLLPPVAESNDIWKSPVDPRKSAVGDIEQDDLEMY